MAVTSSYGHSMNGMNRDPGPPMREDKQNPMYGDKDYKCCSERDEEFSGSGKEPEMQVIQIDSPSSPSLCKGHLLEDGQSPDLPRKWEYFPGNNRFFCNGRVMTAPSIRFCVLSFGLILMTFLLFVIFDGPFLSKRLTIAIPIIGSVLFLSVIVNMVKTSFSDPGILPRASQQEWEYVEKSYATNNQSRPPPRTKDIIVNGQIVKSKFCFTCKMFRPPRASHCGVCDNCVDRFDHHCPFLGNCIGKRNYRSFYAFIVSLSFLAVFVLSCSIAHLAIVSKEKGNFLEALKESPTSAVVVVISFFGMWTVLGLSGFHTYLIAVEQTTNEDIKGLFGRASVKNPFSRGNFCQNCCFVLCGPAQPSLIDPRGFATADFMSSLPKKIESNGLSQSSKCQNLNLQTSIKTGPTCVDGGNSQPGISKVHQQQPLMYQSPVQQNQQPVQLSSPTTQSSNLPTPVIPHSSPDRESSIVFTNADGLNRSLGDTTSESMRNLYSSIEEDPRISPDPITVPKSRKPFMSSMLNGNSNTAITAYGPNGFFSDDFDDPTILHPASASYHDLDYDNPDDPIPLNTVVSGRRSKKIKSGSRPVPNSAIYSASVRDKSRCDKSLEDVQCPSHKSSERLKPNSPKVKRVTNHTMINSPLHLDTIM